LDSVYFLFLIGSKIIFEFFSGNIEKVIENNFEKKITKDSVNITHKVMFTHAIATSIDALVAGFTLTILDVNPFVACAIIAVATLVFSGVGVFFGVKSGT
jgi:putative Mn2+ efflux pump MntP